MYSERTFNMKFYISDDGLSMQFTNERQQTIASAFLNVDNPNASRLLTVFREAVSLEIEQVFQQFIIRGSNK